MSGWIPEPGVTEWLQYLAKYAADDLLGFFSICKLLPMSLYLCLLANYRLIYLMRTAMLLCRSFYHTNAAADCERLFRLPAGEARREENEKTRTERYYICTLTGTILTLSLQKNWLLKQRRDSINNLNSIMTDFIIELFIGNNFNNIEQHTGQLLIVLAHHLRNYVVGLGAGWSSRYNKNVYYLFIIMTLSYLWPEPWWRCSISSCLFRSIPYNLRMNGTAHTITQLCVELG